MQNAMIKKAVICYDRLEFPSLAVPDDVRWMQHVLDNWSEVCMNELHIERKSLPWIIFYDSTYAWHLNADEKIMPPFERTSQSVTFAGTSYGMIRIAHANSLWVPDRESIPLASRIVTTIPYAQNKKALFLAPLPSLFHKFAPADQAPFLDFLFLGMNIHELTHTRQLPFVLPQLVEIDRTDHRESLDDNTVEHEFSKDQTFTNLYFAENRHLWNAAFATQQDSCLAEAERAWKLMEIRQRQFFTGANESLKKADEIFLSLEGSAMWAQYRIMLKNTPHPNERELLAWIVQQAPAWSQERGLVMFLLIDRFSKDWKDRFFEKPLPGATTYLREVLKASKH